MCGFESLSLHHIMASKCSWTHVALSLLKKGIVTPWSRQVLGFFQQAYIPFYWKKAKRILLIIGDIVQDKNVVILSGTYKKDTNSRPLEKQSYGIIQPYDYVHYRSIGPYQIAHHLRTNGIPTQVLDFVQTMPTEMIVNYFKQFFKKDEPKIIGISTSFLSKEYDRFLPQNILVAIQWAKNHWPDVKVVMGGSLAHKYNLKANRVDYALYSYSEDATLKLFKSIVEKTPIDINFKLNPKIHQENVLYDTTKCNHRFTDDDCIREGETLPIEISRGCIFKCRFCRFPHIGKKKNDYVRDMELVKEEMLYNYEKWGTTRYYLVDDTFNETPDKVRAFHDMVVSLPFKIEWTAYLRVDLIHRARETIKLLYDSGCRGAFFGVETFNPEAAKLVAKGWSGQPLKDFILELKEAWPETNITLSLIIGLPPETYEQAVETMEWIEENKIDSWGWHVLAISERAGIDASEFERNPEKYGFKVNGVDYHNGHVSRAEIVTWYKKLMERESELTKNLSSWAMFEHVQYTKDLQSARNTTVSEALRDQWRWKRSEWFYSYIDKLNKLR